MRFHEGSRTRVSIGDPFTVGWVFLGTIVVFLNVVLKYFLPIFLAITITKSDWSVLMVLFIVGALSVLLKVRGVSITPTGIYLVRFLGWPKLIPWDQVLSVGSWSKWKRFVYACLPVFPSHIVLSLSKDAIALSTTRFTIHLRPACLPDLIRDLQQHVPHLVIDLGSKKATEAGLSDKGQVSGTNWIRNIKSLLAVFSLIIPFCVFWVSYAAMASIILIYAFPDIGPVDDRDLQLENLNITAQENSYQPIRELGFARLEASKTKWQEINMSVASWDQAAADRSLNSSRASLDLFYELERRKYFQDPYYIDVSKISFDTQPSTFGYVRDVTSIGVLLAKEKAVHQDLGGALLTLDQNLDLAHKMANSRGSIGDLMESAAITNITTRGIKDIATNFEVPSSELLKQVRQIEKYKRIDHGTNQAIRVEYRLRKNEIERMAGGQMSDVFEPLAEARPTDEMDKFAEAIVSRSLFKPNRTMKTDVEQMRLYISQIGVPCGISDKATKKFEIQRTKDFENRSLLEFASNMGGIMFDLMSITPYMLLPDRACLNEFRLSSTQVLLAIKAYQQDTGTMPDDLNFLVPKYLPRVPRDPYDGKELRYSREQRLIYSIGDDLVDKGGGEPKYPEDDNEPTIKIEF